MLDEGRVGWITGIVGGLSGFGLMYAVEAHNWKIAQLASIAGLLLLALSVALLSKKLLLSLSPPTKDGNKETRSADNAEEIRDKLLRRLVIVAGFGLAIIFLYS